MPFPILHYFSYFYNGLLKIHGRSNFITIWFFETIDKSVYHLFWARISYRTYVVVQRFFDNKWAVCVGQKGNKGERGQTDDTRDQIERIQNSISIMQRNIGNLIGK